MDVLNKLRSTVTSTVSSLSGVLPGNPVTREFEATTHICSAGPGLLWKVYAGYKKSTKQEASIFVFEKRALERWPRESRENILESLRKGVTQVTKLRHPHILTVQHPLEESRDSLAFATEPVFASLANVLGNHDGMPSELSPAFRDYKLYDVERKYGFLQIGEGLAFLHGDVKLLHNNICPESVVINHQGAWKIFGFDFCVLGDVQPDGHPSWKCVEYSPYTAHVAQPSLDYTAPEAILSNTRSRACDMFSLGALIYAVYHDGSPPVCYHGEFTSYKNRVSELKKFSAMTFDAIPVGLREITKMLLNFTPELRPDAHQFKKIDFFEDIGVKTLNYLDALFQWDKLQKSQFYKGLPTVVQNFPHRVNLYRVIPALGKEFSNPTMVPFVLPVVLQIAESSTKEEYMKHIFPYLRTAMKLSDPIQILLIFMQKMELLLKMTQPEEVKTDVFPMLYRALDSDAQQIQELCLSVLPTYANLIDYPSMKNAMLPRIKKLCIGTAFLSVRVNCLLCVGKLLEHLDKWLVLDEVLPFLQQVPSREPAVLMGILGIYKIALTHKKLGIPKEVLATKAIPFLMPMTIENGLTLAQFNTLFSVLRDMMNRVETEHRTKIEQLSAITNEAKSLNFSGSSKVEPVETSKIDLNSIFSTGSGQSVQNGLSLEDKQRIMREQEACNKFALNSNPLIPRLVEVKNQPAPKDLTATLLESNLANLSVTKNTTASLQQSFTPAFGMASNQMSWNLMGGAMNASSTIQPTFVTSPMLPAPVQPYLNSTFSQSLAPTTAQNASGRQLSSSEIADLLG